MIRGVHIRLLGALLTGLLAAACTSPFKPRVIGDIDGLVRVPDKFFDEAYQREDFSFADYNGFYIEPVDTLSGRGHENDFERVPDSERLKVQRYVHSALVEGVGRYYPVVDRPGPKVLVIRPFLTQLYWSRPPVNISVKRSTNDGDTKPRVAIQMEFFDGETGELKAVIVDKFRQRRRWSSSWGHVRTASGTWSKVLRTRIDASKKLE